MASNDYGTKITRPGFDVHTAADRELVFSSSWPILKIQEEGTGTIDDSGPFTITTHNLGYNPAFILFVDDGSGTEIVFTGISQFIQITDTELKWTADAATLGRSVEYRYYIFYHNLATEFTADNIELSETTSNEGKDYGIKIAKEGKDIYSTDPRDYVLHSGYRQWMLHKSGAGTSNGTGDVITITHDLGYKPVYFLYALDTSPGATDVGYHLFGNADDSTVTATTSTISFEIAGLGFDYAYMIFKDNLELA